MKVYQSLLVGLSLLASIFFLLVFGWQSYATVTEQPGIYGNIHEYYNLSKEAFTLYHLSFLALILGLIFYQIILIWKKNYYMLIRSLWYLIFALGLILLFHLYLTFLFIPKG